MIDMKGAHVPDADHNIDRVQNRWSEPDIVRSKYRGNRSATASKIALRRKERAKSHLRLGQSYDRVETDIRIAFLSAKLNDVLNTEEHKRHLFAFTVHISDQAQKSNLERSSHKQVANYKASLLRHLSRRLKRSVHGIWFVIETQDRKQQRVRPHMHGMLVLHSNEVELATAALRAAAGGVHARPNSVKVKLLKSPADAWCWALYCNKNRSALYVSQAMSRIGRHLWRKSARGIKKKTNKDTKASPAISSLSVKCRRSPEEPWTERQATSVRH
ncbi:hypothetical protein FIU97_02780 [Roseivivax sp. THAF40]|nr:hypothetical protein FIU97_02780 [Roseivivax sp. THAF40]